MSVEPSVAVEELVVRYGEVTAVDGIDFTAVPGEVLALLGPNGAGKTSTVEVLEGYRRPDAGRVRVLGHDPVGERHRVVGRIGIMLQNGGVYPGVRPLEMLRLLAALYADPVDPADLLDRVGLAGCVRTTWRQLSGGEQQRLSLAMALVGRPRVAFLDEPTAGVDVRGRQLIRSLVRDLADNGCTVVLCTHELDEAERIADRVIIIDRGAVVATGTLDELRTTDAGTVRFSAAGAVDAVALSQHLGAPVVNEGDGEYRIDADPTSTGQLSAALTSWLVARGHALGDLRVGRQRLEDVFLALTDSDPVVQDSRARRTRARRRERR